MRREDFPAAHSAITIMGVGMALVHDTPDALMEMLDDVPEHGYITLQAIDQRTCQTARQHMKASTIVAIAEVLPIRWHEHIPDHLLDRL